MASGVWNGWGLKRTDKRIEEMLKRDPRNVKYSEFRQILAFAREVDIDNIKWVYVDFEFYTAFSLFKDPMIFYAVFYVLTAFAGVLVSPVWYNLQLYDIVVSCSSLVLINQILSPFFRRNRSTPTLFRTSSRPLQKTPRPTSRLGCFGLWSSTLFQFWHSNTLSKTTASF